MGRALSLAFVLTSAAAVVQVSKPAVVPPTLTLQVQRSEARVIGDIAVPEEWVTSLSIPARGVLRFRFGIEAVGLTLRGSQPHAEWRVYEGAPPLNDFDGKAANLRARGDAGEIPTILTPHVFLIDLEPVLPWQPDNKSYFINVTGRHTDGTFSSRYSPAVVVKYQATVRRGR